MIRAITLLIGTTIGAGILGIPYALYRGGFLTGLIVAVVVALAMIFINLFIGEITLRTNKTYELSGYASKYLGVKGRNIMVITMVLGIYGSLVAYLIGQGEVLEALLPVTPLQGTIIFFLLASMLLYKGLSVIGRFEQWMVIGIALITIALYFMSVGNINADYLTGFNGMNIFMPFGVLVFAFKGMVAIPEMKEELCKNKRKLKKAIIIGGLLPLALYIVFSFVVIGTSAVEFGSGETMANLVLDETLGKTAGLLMNVFAFFAMATSFLSLGLALKWVFHLDFGLSNKISWLATIIPPIAVVLLGLTSFISTLGYVGAVTGGLQAVLVVVMHNRSRRLGERDPEFTVTGSRVIAALLIVFFLAGMVFGTMYA
ncbi:MAG: aromatic amino acid transport family protein [Nanobdellota archaeon]